MLLEDSTKATVSAAGLPLIKGKKDSGQVDLFTAKLPLLPTCSCLSNRLPHLDRRENDSDLKMNRIAYELSSDARKI